jgi:hypothetical protein
MARGVQTVLWLASIVVGFPVVFWVVVIFVGLVIIGVVLTAVELGSFTSQATDDWHYQCDSAIGPDPAVTETTAPSTTAAVTESMAPSQWPTANPYAGLTFALGDSASAWDLACATAMASAPYQQQPLQTPVSGAAMDCARQVALTYVGRRVTQGVAALTQEVAQLAAIAGSTGRCQVPATTGTGSSSGGAAAAVSPEVPSVASAGTCAQLAVSPESVLLPSTVAAQGLCGQRVAQSATSAGDLVFWSYSNNAPTRAGIAVSASQIVTVDPETGMVVEEGMPTGNDVRVKRVLEGAS